jgi:uncharacterized membrane protein YfcA
MTLIILLSLVIGLLLGLLGGGGSILTVPVLVYLVNVEPKTAIATSLLVVGVTSLTAVLSHARTGRVCWRTGLIFGVAGMLGSYAGGRLAAYIPGGILLLLFAAIMFGTALAMLRSRRDENFGGQELSAPPCPAHLPILAILFDGLIVGGLTGLVGAGGGFLVVPALNLLGGLSMHAAVATSLLVIAMKSFAGLGGYIAHVNIDFQLAGIVTGAAIVGSLFGGFLSHRISAMLLRRGFGAFVILIACYLLYKELKPDLMMEAQELIRQHPDFLRGMGTMLALMLLFRIREWIHARGHAERRPISNPKRRVG